MDQSSAAAKAVAVRPNFGASGPDSYETPAPIPIAANVQGKPFVARKSGRRRRVFRSRSVPVAGPQKSFHPPSRSHFLWAAPVSDRILIDICRIDPACLTIRLDSITFFFVQPS